MADPFLFGDRAPWSGAEIVRLTAIASPTSSHAADVDLNPLDRTRAVVVNATDAQRAEIVRRYRLFSYQPDEMNTLMALASMHPGQGDLDPKMYKYGGLWVYPVGAILKLGSIAKLIDLRGGPDALAFYMDHPEAFARFYVAARLYTVGWALVGVGAVFFIARRSTRSNSVAAFAAMTFAAMPAVVNAAHEAKPHLPGVTLTLLAVIAAARYAHDGRRKSLLLTGLACGAAVGMVPSALPALLVIPVAALLRRMGWRDRVVACLLGASVAVAVYAATNPYVPINLFRDRALLRSHFGNSADFYRFGGRAALPNAGRLIAAGMSPVLAGAGLLGAALLGARAIARARRSASWGDGLSRHAGPALAGGERSVGAPPDRNAEGTRTLWWLLAVPAAMSLAQFVAFAAGQPGDYARFALLADAVLALAAVCAVRHLARHPGVRAAGLLLLFVPTVAAGACYDVAFCRDEFPGTSRTLAGWEIRKLQARGLARAILTSIEPAPFSAPPMDLFRSEITLPPRGSTPGIPPGGILVRPVESANFKTDGDAFFVAGRSPPRWLAFLGFIGSTPLSWADKPFEGIAPAGGNRG